MFVRNGCSSCVSCPALALALLLGRSGSERIGAVLRATGVQSCGCQTAGLGGGPGDGDGVVMVAQGEGSRLGGSMASTK